MLEANEYFCEFFCRYALGKVRQFFFPKYNKYWQLFLRLLLLRTGRGEKIHRKVATCFYLEVLKLVNVTDRRGEIFKSITSSLFSRTQQKQAKKTKTKLNLHRTNQNWKQNNQYKQWNRNMFVKKGKECWLTILEYPCF